MSKRTQEIPSSPTVRTMPMSLSTPSSITLATSNNFSMMPPSLPFSPTSPPVSPSMGPFSPTTTMPISTMPEKGYYFKNTIDGIVGSLKHGPLPAIVVRAGPRWKCTLDLDTLQPGWYSIVICMSLKNMDVKALRSLTIDAKQLDEDNHAVFMAKTCKTIINSDELRQIPTERFTRVRLHRQIELDAGGPMELAFSFGAGALGSFELRYVSLESGQNGIYDHVLYGQGKPQQFISVGEGGEGSYRKTLNVHSYAISSTGSHAVTLYFDHGRAFLEIWDLRESKEEAFAPAPRVHNVPVARAFIKAFSTNHPDLMDISLSISSFGSQVVLHSAEPSESGIPCHIFNCDAPAPADHDLSKPWTLSLKTICQGLHGYYGYGAFQFGTSEAPHERDERYVTCDGSTVSVYNIHGEWSRIRTMTLNVEANLDAALAMFLSMRGRYFAWTGVKGVVSIWDVTAGKQVSFIPMEDDHSTVYANMSRDGSMVAISVKGRISIYQTFTGVKLGDYEPGTGDENYFEVVLEKDHFLVMDQPGSDPHDAEQIGCRRLISTRDMSVAKTLRIHQDYEVQYPVPVSNPAFAYAQGSVVNIVKAANALAPPREGACGHDCMMSVLPVDIFTQDETLEYCYEEGPPVFSINASESRINGTRMSVITISCLDSAKPRQFTLPLGPAQVNYSGVFVPMTSQLVLATGRYIQVWKLSATPGTELAVLELVWKLKDEGREHASDICHRKIASASACNHGRHLALDLYPERWLRKSRELPRVAKRNAFETVTLPLSTADNIGTTESFRVNHGVQGLVDMYAYANSECQEAIISHLQTLVRPSTKTRTSAIVTLCRFWTPEKKFYVQEIIASLLPNAQVTWVPEQDNNAIDPLAVILKAAESQPSAINVAKIIMDYCVSHANSSKNLAFLTPIFGSWRQIMSLAPAEALKCLDRTAFIPVQQRAYIVNNHRVAHSPRPRLAFWKQDPNPLWKSENPIMHLEVSSKKPDPMNDQFQLPVFVASFDALWQYKHIPAKLEEERPRGRGLWWQTVFYSAWLKLRLNSQAYVESKDISLEYFDNPAISALIAYKWNTIGYKYWTLRFFFQCLYYILVTVVAILQVYFPDFRVLRDAFIAIIALSVMFLWLELSRAVRCWTRYKSNSYNVAGLLAYFLPMVAAIDQLVVITMTDLDGNARLLSFSVLAVFVNMLYELRVNMMVCKYVTIIQRAVGEILAFFVIFGVGIATFTIAILHVLHACPAGSCTRDPTSQYPTQFFGALTSTFFFLAGRFGPINDELSSEDWGFKVMMIFCYLFTNIVMMNVLISLFSMTFIKGDDFWRLTWLECRLRYIESAENMSYHIQGFRDSHDYFPKEIYYTAEPLKVNAFFEKRHPALFKQIFAKHADYKEDDFEDGKPDGHHNNNNSNGGDTQSISSGISSHQTLGDDTLQIHHHEKREKAAAPAQAESTSSSASKPDLSTIAATLAEMQRSIQEMREPISKRDPKAAAAYERAQARDLVEHWISARVDEDAIQVLGESSQQAQHHHQQQQQQYPQQQFTQQQQPHQQQFYQQLQERKQARRMTSDADSNGKDGQRRSY
ncbi:hypothetical protein BGZ98_002613 [Dissophora globulifera]|nr:hypothetical protein BGZ98_002613 [Dissophora globulifera]